MPSPVTHLREAVSRMSPLGKLAVAVAALALLAALVTGGGVIGDRLRAAKYNRSEAARMKQVQASLAAAEAAEKRAEAKEAQAELLKQQNEAKATKTTAADASIERETKDREQQISKTYEEDLRRINSDLTVCDRCRDVCSKLDDAARANPDFGQYRCDADACSEDCPAGNP
jgi:ribosomal protein L14E/L6E/L27E